MTKNTAPKPPADLNSPTGYCSHRNHAKCPYRPGGACENGIGLSDGGFYMCPCSCHMKQKHMVQGKRLQVSLDTRKSAVAVEQQEDSPKSRKSVVATILADHRGHADADTRQARSKANREVVAAAMSAAKKGQPASPKSTESTPKVSGKGKASTAAAAKPQATNGGLSTAEKKEVRIKMAATLRAMSSSTLYALDEREMAYVEAHWLKYIDPDLDKARRDAAAAK